jgi:hypothetical protein
MSSILAPEKKQIAKILGNESIAMATNWEWLKQK